eukprot:736572_1
MDDEDGVVSCFYHMYSLLPPGAWSLQMKTTQQMMKRIQMRHYYAREKLRNCVRNAREQIYETHSESMKTSQSYGVSYAFRHHSTKQDMKKHQQDISEENTSEI